MATANAPDPAQANAPFCGRCGSQGKFYPALNQYGCDKCQMLPMQARAAAAANVGPAGYGVPGYNPYAAAPPTALACPQCRMPATFYPQTNQWGCDRCRIPVTPPPLQLRPAGNDAGMVVLRVVGTIILIIIAVAIRVGLR